MLRVLDGDWNLQMLQPPASEPLTLDQAKQHLRIPLDVTDFDANVTEYIAGARSYMEYTYGLPVMQQKVRVNLQQFPSADRIRLPIWPVQSVDASRYITVDGQAHPLTVGDSTTQPVPDILARLWRKPSELVLPWSHIWPPVVLQMADAVQFDLTVGFVTNASPELRPLPPALLAAMRLLIGHQYEQGAAVTVVGRPSERLAIGVDDLLRNIRLF